jgi:predicted ATPase/class 3 adenylate cyclase/DNA-binding CsgD family transcriptional regulator
MFWPSFPPRFLAMMRNWAAPVTASLAMMEPVGLPSGTLTFLLSDVEGSTHLWEVAREPMAVALPRSLQLVEEVASAHGGVLPVEQGEGDSRLAVFPRAADALAAALAIQRAMTDEAWPAGAGLRVRIALHAGDARLRDERTYGGGVVHRAARLRALARGGQVLVSRAVHDLVADELPAGMELADLGRHRLRDLSRPEEVFELRHPDLPVVDGGLRSLAAVPNNLPSAVSSFVGRVAERGQLGELVSAHRLVTVTGPGGCGKTRLTLEVAADTAADRPDGIWLAELSGVADPDLVADTVLAAVDVGEVAGMDAIDRLSTFLQSRRALLVIDNCEHLVDAVADAAHRLLQACPNLVLVATSREPLGVTGETVWRVPPMTIGSNGEGDAEALFAERARAVRANFTVNDANQDAVASICRRLDGIPLAIELAAARARSMSVKDIAAGLDDRFRLLAGGSRTALARQRTLQASVQWSYELTDPLERAVLRRLAVFQGSFDVAAAERIAAAGEVDEVAVLDLLGRLVDKSLVQVEEAPDGEVRYRLLDTIRHFGRDRLADEAEVEATQARHLAWVRDLSEKAEPTLEGGDLATLIRLDDQLDDIRVALAWACSDPERAATAVAIVGALGMYWLLRARYREGIDWCREALAADPERAGVTDRLRARWALVNAEIYGIAGEIGEAAVEEAAVIADAAAAVGHTVLEARCRGLVGLAVGFAEPAAGMPLLDQVVPLADEAGDDFTQVDNRHNRGYVHLFRGNLAASAADFAAVRPVAERLGNGWHLGFDGHARAFLALAGGDPAAAVAVARAGQAAARRTGESNSDACASWALCNALVDHGRPAEALRELTNAEERFARRPGFCTEACMTAARAYVLSSMEDDEAAAVAARRCITAGAECGVPWMSGFGVLHLAAVERRSGDFAAASATLTLVDEAVDQGVRYFVPDVALERARLCRAAGQPDQAEEQAHAALVAAVEMGFRKTAVLALEELAHLSASAGSAAEAARLLGAGRAARRTGELVPNAEERRWIEATTSTVVALLGDEAAGALRAGEELSLEDAVAYARRARGERGRPAAGWGSLTPTERQVVDLVVAGFTNPQIAERLLMSRGTVKAHLTHVFTKLAVASRAELAAVAARQAQASAR